MRGQKVLVADTDPQGSARDVLTARAVDIKDVIAVQRAALKAADPWARQQATHFLGKLGPLAKDAADDLAALLDDKDEGCRKAAAEALKSIRGK